MSTAKSCNSDELQYSPYHSCWLWRGWRDKKGYGKFQHKNRTHSAHRYVALLAGLINEKQFNDTAIHICHHCDTPPCINPSHLYAGNIRTNAKDKVKRARSLYNERNPKAKLTAENIQRMRNLFSSGSSYSTLAKLYNVNYSTVHRAINKVTWWRI